MQERMEGLQGWMAEIERKQARMTRFGGAAAILAVLAAAGALALGIINKNDAATKDDVDELTTKVNELGASLEQQTEKQLKGLQGRLSSIDQRLSAVEQKQSQLQTQVQALETRAASGKGAAATVPTVPPVVGGTTP
jgi:chromosome segregation ATPase